MRAIYGAPIRKKRLVSMWLPEDLIDRLDELGGRGRTANLVAILDQAFADADAVGRKVRRKLKPAPGKDARARRGGDEQTTIPGTTTRKGGRA